MRQFGLAFLCATTLLLIGCGGGSSSSSNYSGNWSATLSAKGSTVLSFNALLTQGSSTQLNVSNLIFTLATTCFGSGSTASSTFGTNGMANGTAANAFQMTVLSGSSNLNGTNQVVLQGTLGGNMISGTWDMTGTGSGCTGSGSFTMSKF